MAVGWEAASGKFALCARMLEVMWQETEDRWDTSWLVWLP